MTRPNPILALALALAQALALALGLALAVWIRSPCTLFPLLCGKVSRGTRLRPIGRNGGNGASGCMGSSPLKLPHPRARIGVDGAGSCMGSSPLKLPHPRARMGLTEQVAAWKALQSWPLKLPHPTTCGEVRLTTYGLLFTRSTHGGVRAALARRTSIVAVFGGGGSVRGPVEEWDSGTRTAAPGWRAPGPARGSRSSGARSATC